MKRIKHVLVTGALGNAGRLVIDALIERGMQPTAAHYDVERARRVLPDTVPVVAFDFRDPATWDAAATAQDAVFLVRPPPIADVEDTLNPFVTRAREQGVEHVVFLSVAGAEKNRFVPHRKVEDFLAASNIPHTNLRPGFFSQNLEDAYVKDIVDDNRIFVPAGRAPVNWVDLKDVADVAARIFEDPQEHAGKSYRLAGPGPVEWTTICELLSRDLERTIRYVPASVLGYIFHLRRRGLPAAAIAVQTILHVSLRFGAGATEDDTLEELLGRERTAIADYIGANRDKWMSTTSG